MDDLACLSPPERVTRWAQLLEQVDTRIRDRGETRADWVRLKLTLIRKGQTLEVYSSADAAIRTAAFVADLHRQGMAGEVAAVLPTADDVVIACLAEIRVSPEQAVTRRALADLDVTAIRRTRQAKILIEAAEPHSARVRDPRLMARLHRWMVLKPELV